jgi:predicted ATP-grasp superfamily ATP-dependent carboligase
LNQQENAITAQPLLILGASARAAAWSALRSGNVRPWCIDLFVDADLQRACRVEAIAASAYPGGLVELVGRAPPGPWCYTGGFENHPRVIEALARERSLWGNTAAVVRQVRSPERVAQVLRQAGLPCPAVAAALPLSAGKAWLVKPRRSAGGKNIQRWRGQPIPRWSYAQEWIEGEPCSAFFVAASGGSSTFLGATRQLIGLPWLQADPFRYCGNVGPLSLDAAGRAQLEKLGHVLTQAFSLRGLFGVDFILKDQVAWPIEVNPRYTAGMEVVERASRSSFFSRHLQVFEPETSPVPNPPVASNLQSVVPIEAHGKAVLFAKKDLTFTEDGPWQDSLRIDWTDAEAPDFADIPQPQTHIAQGQPIMTVFAHGACEADCLRKLQDKIKALDQWLFGS